ncbi:MAG: ABC transporter ATP-binding protein [Candidatus Altiarchaeota archaeon]
MKTVVNIEKLAKSYQGEPVLADLSLRIGEGTFISLVGPNGCGKTTLVKLIAEVEQQDSGDITVRDGTKVSFVFQNYQESFLPWRTVEDNIALPLEITGDLKKDDKLASVIKEFNLGEHKNKQPYELSGGWAQLTAIARAVVVDPDILILDEPFKSLDFHAAQNVMGKLLAYCEKKRITTILVSHDIDQAILFADRLLVFSQRPGIIKHDLDIQLPRPRKVAHLGETQFFHLKNTTLKLIYDGFKNAG